MAASRRLTLSRHALPALGPNMAVKITVEFQAGGLNYSTYKTDPRGYVVSALVFEDTGDGCERYRLFDKRSGSMLLEAAPRYSAKRLLAFAAAVAKRVPEAVPCFARGEAYEGLMALAAGSRRVADVAASMPMLEGGL